MNADLIIHHLNQLVTCRGENKLRQGTSMQEIGIIEEGFVAIKDGVFIGLGSGDDFLRFVGPTTQMVDGSGCVLTPGFIDSHTHLVHGGSREHEFKLKQEGVPYLEILKQGGGILNTVEKTREASFSALYEKAKRSLDVMLKHGVTHVEAKSGYGLNEEDEWKQLLVTKALQKDHPVDLSSTFMGAHAIPKEYEGDAEGFLDLMMGLLPRIIEEELAEFCDIFVEEGVFTVDQARRYLGVAKSLGFKLKIHADEIVRLGGATLAAELGCISAEHLMASQEKDFERLARQKVVATLLPCTSFNLNKAYAKARTMIDQGVGVALATDYNPGSSPTENIQLAMQLGAIKCKMGVNEVITAVTINAACGLGVEDRVGSIEVGKQADVVILDVPNVDYMVYHFGVNHVRDVYKKGRLVVKDQQLVY